MNKVGKTGKLFNRYMRLPLYFTIFLIVLSLVVSGIDAVAGFIIAFISLIFVICTLMFHLNSKRLIDAAIVEFAMDFYKSEDKLNLELDIPYAILNAQSAVVWANKAFDEIFQKDMALYNNFERVFGKFDLGGIIDKSEFCVRYDERSYDIKLKRVNIDAEIYYCIYLYDVSGLYEVKSELSNKSLVAGLIYIDNYDEAMQSVEEVRSALLVAMLDRKIKQYLGDEGIVHKLEKDKYFFVSNHKFLQKSMDNRFEILEEAKNISIGNTMKVTLSIGIGDGAKDYGECYEYANMAMEMALARGGDQVVVKDKQGFSYFGGKSQAVERFNRVKARVKAKLLRDLIVNKPKVIIMGHKVMDIDCFGAAIGLWRIAKELDRDVHIIKPQNNTSIKSVLDKFTEPNYPDDLFIEAKEAEKLMDDDALLIVVDVHRPGITEAPGLINLAKDIVVLDHHRQSEDSIKNASLSYIESYASSACELVAEMVQYIDDGVKLSIEEADAMYAGIVIDTQNFKNQTGVKTFEAAAFLKRSGADISRVRKTFREDIDDYMAKAEAIHNLSVYEKHFAISYCPSEGLESPNVIAAQVANDLLNIADIKASIVFTKIGSTVYISARSIDEVNVQVMMEKIGGGGHRAIAGAQLKDVSVEEAETMIKNLISDMIDKGEI